MYLTKELKKITKINPEFVKEYATIILQELLNFRATNGKSDIHFFQSLFNMDYITKEDLINNFENFRIKTFDLSPVHSNILSTVAHKAHNNEDLTKIIIAYFANNLFPQLVNEHSAYSISNLKRIIKKESSKYHSGRLSTEKALFINYVLLVQVGYDFENECFEDIVQILGYCAKYRHSPIEVMINKTTLLETISDILGEDMVAKEKLINRFITRRTEELYNYLLRVASDKSELPASLNINEKVKHICYIACGEKINTMSVAEQLNRNSNRIKEAVSKGAYDLDAEKERILFQSNCIGRTITKNFTDITIDYLGGEYKKEICSQNVIRHFLKSDGYLTPFEHAILEKLLEDLIRNRQTAAEADYIMMGQITRLLTYSDADCQVVIEKIAAAIYENVLALDYRTVVKQDILYADYNYMEKYLWNKCSSENSSQKSVTSSIHNITRQAVTEVSERLESEKEKTEKLEKENRQLREQLLELQNQLNRSDIKQEIIKELKEKVEMLSDESESRNIRIRQLTEKRKHQLNSKPLQTTNLAIEDSFFQDKKIIIVGGRWEVNRKFEKLIPKVKIVNTETEEVLDVRNYDVVIFFTDFINHSKYMKYINKCRIYSTPTLYLRGSNFEALKREIYVFYEGQELLKDA